MNNSKKISVQYSSQIESLADNISTLEELKAFIKKKFENLPEKIKIFYVDSDDDEITISSEEELNSFKQEEMSINLIMVKDQSDSDFSANEDEEEEDDDEEEEDVDVDVDINEDEDDSEVSAERLEIATEVFNIENQKIEPKENVSLSQAIQKQDQSEQTGNQLQDSSDQTHFIEQKDTSTQSVAILKDNSLQTQVEQNDLSTQFKVSTSDYSSQFTGVQQDLSTQFIIASQDIQTQAQVESSDFQTQALIDKSDLQTQAQVESVESSMQTGEKAENKISQCSISEEVTDLIKKQGEQLKLMFERRVREIEEKMKVELEERDKQIQEIKNQQNLINQSYKKVEEKADPQQSSKISEKSLLQQQNIIINPNQDRVAELQIALAKASSDFSRDSQGKSVEQAESLFNDVLQQLQQVVQAKQKVNLKVPEISDEEKSKILNSLDSKKQGQIEEDEEEEEEKEQKIDISSQKLKDSHKIQYNSSALKQISEKQEKEIQKVLQEKEKQELGLNKELSKSEYKGFSKNVVEKAQKIAELTGEQPHIYLKYVSDYQNHPANDLIDMLFNENISSKYFPKDKSKNK